jgi:hypothetical protein
MRFLISLLLILTAAQGVLASRGRVLNTSGAPYFLNSDRAFLPHKVLGSTCSSFRSISKEPACNPALLGEDQSSNLSKDDSEKSFFAKGYFAANLFFGDDYETLYKNKDVISANDKLALAQSLLSEKEPIRFSGAANLWWRGEKAAMSYQPLRLSYFSFVKNQAYPDVVVHAMQEQSVNLQYGGFLNENWRAGVQTRLVERKFVHEEFNLFDAIPNIDNYLKLKSQKLILLEPGLAYELHGDDGIEKWRPVFTANLSNLGFADQSYDEVPRKGILDTGFSLSPPLSFGELELGLNYRWSSEIDGDKKFRLGGQYRLGLAGFLFAIDPDQWSLGVISAFRSVSAGLMYERTRIENFDGRPIYEDSGYVEFRISL